MKQLDARRLAADQGEITGTVRLSDWPRAAEEVVDPEASIGYRITGGSDGSGRPQLQLQLTGAVDVTCQRCLQPMRLNLSDGMTSVLLASNEEQLESWDNEVEDAEVVLAREPLDLDEMLEDEFLLSLPFSPMCDDPTCRRRASVAPVEVEAAPEAGKNNPFGALRGKLAAKPTD